MTTRKPWIASKRNAPPSPPPKQVQKVLDNNAKLEKKLELIARSGVPEPPLPKVTMEEVSNPRTQSTAKQKFKQLLKVRTSHQSEMKDRISELGKVTKEAEVKSRAAHEIADFWAKMMKAPAA